MFVTGFIFGVLFVVVLLIIEVYLDIKKKKIVEIIKEVVVDKIKEKGVIIPAPDEKEIAQVNLRRYNEERGQGTPLKDLD